MFIDLKIFLSPWASCLSKSSTVFITFIRFKTLLHHTDQCDVNFGAITVTNRL